MDSKDIFRGNHPSKESDKAWVNRMKEVSVGNNMRAARGEPQKSVLSLGISGNGPQTGAPTVTVIFQSPKHNRYLIEF